MGLEIFQNNGTISREVTKIGDRQFISDVVNPSDFKKGTFNLIYSGCGTGKSHFIANSLLDKFSDVKPYEVLMVTSRSLTADQQGEDYESMSKYDPRDLKRVRFWNGTDDDEEYALSKGIQITTYDKLIHIIVNRNSIGRETLNRIKILVLDEAHTLFSDRYIDGVDALTVWIRDCILYRDMLIVGMSATPEIIFENQLGWGVPIKQVNKDFIQGYQAKRLICTNFDSIPYLVCSNRLQGKTIIMCPTIEDCETLKAQIPNSTILVSQNRKGYYNDEMRKIRQCIIEEKRLPDYYEEKTKDGKVNQYELQVLICTSTAREGFNLIRDSGVKNAISCLTDGVHVVQFSGRARYDLDVLVVADTFIRGDNRKVDDYLVEQRKLFKNYMRGVGDNQLQWFMSIAHIVDVTAAEVEKFTIGVCDAKFISYINGRWLVPCGTGDNYLEYYKIWRDKDKDEIVNMFKRYRISGRPVSMINFLYVMKTLEDKLGYEVTKGKQRFQDEGNKHYRLVMGYDEMKSQFIEDGTLAVG